MLQNEGGSEISPAERIRASLDRFLRAQFAIDPDESIPAGMDRFRARVRESIQRLQAPDPIDATTLVAQQPLRLCLIKSTDPEST